MKLTPLPERIRTENGWTPEMHEWYKENEEAIYEAFEQTFHEWFEDYIDHLADVRDVSLGEKIKI